MKKNRRSFMNLLFGILGISSLAGCIESKNDGDNNNSSEINNQENEDIPNEVNRTLTTKVELFTYEIDSCSKKEENKIKNIFQSDENKYSFTGIEYVDSDCYDLKPNCDVINGRLNVQLNLIKTDNKKCKNCDSKLSYSGVVRVPSDKDITDSEINIIKSNWSNE